MLKFFTKDEEERIIQAIRAAESHTSGEIRVHLEKDCKHEILREAGRIFRKLGMHKTTARNGVLILLAPERKEFAIVGDEGIHDKVGQEFWAEERDLIQHHFQKEAFADGICLAVVAIGQKLKAFFPVKDDGVNELPDEISYG